MIDWNLHKDKIANQFSNVTGKKVVFSGPVSFNVFPSPYLTASNVKIYNDSADMSAPPLATINELVAELSLFPLLHGNFDVKKMFLREPEMFVEVLPEGKINWQSNLPVNYDAPKERIEVALDSVMIEKAKLNIVSKELGLNLSFDNLNAEIIADSIFGPYRIEGSYINDNNPEGFALSLGQFSESFATSLNFVIRHPKSDSYLRFDGSFFLKNSAVNGSVVVESARLTDFVNSYFPRFTFDKKYEFPLAMSMEVNTNRTKIDVSNFVVKYGGTAGAGNILIPLKADEFNTNDSETVERKKVEVAFNMTDLDLNPFIMAINDSYKDSKDYKLDLGYDILFDLKSVKTVYKDQNIRDFVLSFDLLDKSLNLHSLGGIFPGETTLTTQGNIFSKDEKLSYNFDITANSLDFLKLSSWLGYNLPAVNNTTYRNFEISTGVSGNNEVTKIAPLKVKVDKTNFSGEMGIVWGDRPNIYANMDIDAINFDNYFEKIPDEVSAKGWGETFKYAASKLGIINDYEIKFDTNLLLGIYNSVPFENTEIAFSADKGVVNLEKLNITSVKNSTMDFTGTLQGFGTSNPSFSNIKYNVSTQDFYSLFSNDNLPTFMKQANDFKKFEAKGIITGNFDKYVTKTVFKLDDINAVYSGEVSKINNEQAFNGKLDLRTPDFVKFVNKFGVNYAPTALSMGVLRIGTNISGSDKKFSLKDMELFIGPNTFKGSLDYSKVEDKNNISFDLAINRFELDRFFYNKGAQANSGAKFSVENAAGADFLTKPFWDKTAYDYTPFQKYTINGKVAVETLTYGSEDISGATFALSLDNQLLRIQNLSGKYHNGAITSALIELGMFGSTYIKGDINLANSTLDSKYFSGLKYGLLSGSLNMNAVFNTAATSFFDMMTNLTGEIKFNISNPVLKGWDLDEIEIDLEKRTVSEGLTAFLQANLQTGKTEFDDFSGRVTFNMAAFQFFETKFSKDNVGVGVVANGDIGLWDMKTNYVADYFNTKSKFKLNYSLSGPISTPSLFVDATNIAAIYDNKNRQIAEEQKEKAKRRSENLIFEVDKERERSAILNRKIDEKIRFIMGRLESVTNETVKQEYSQIMHSLQVQESEIAGMLGETQNPQNLDLNEDYIKNMNRKNDNYEKTVSDLLVGVDGIYYRDIKEALNSKYNSLADKYGRSRQNVVKYRDEFVKYPVRMAVMGKVFVLDNDAKITELKSKIESGFSAMDNINTEASQEYIVAQALNNLDEIKAYDAQVDRSLVEVDARAKEIDETIVELNEYTEALVTAQEEAYDAQVKDTEVKNKLDANKGSISANGKVTTLVRDISEIKKSEEAVAGEGVKVLDFSKIDSKVEEVKPAQKVISREEVNRIITEKTEGILSKKEGSEKSSVSGVIIKK